MAKKLICGSTAAAVAMTILVVTSVANATTIAVLDSAPATSGGLLTGGTLYNKSTGGESITGLTGSFSATELTFGGVLSSDYWDDTGDPSSQAGFLQNNGTSATWTIGGLASVATDVYVNWRKGGQVNCISDAAYTVNGVAVPGVFNQTGAVPADLTLTDPLGTSINFASLGTHVPNGLGQIIVGVTDTGTSTSEFVVLDAVAISGFILIPEPSTLTLAALGLLGLLACGWRRRR